LDVVAHEESLRTILVSGCEEFSSLLGITEDVKKNLKEIYKAISARKEEIVRTALDSISKNNDLAEALKKAGLDETRSKRLFEYWFTTIFQSDYGERHCLDVARIGLLLVRGGFPLHFLSPLVSVFLSETLKTSDGEPSHIVMLAKVFGWNLAVMILSYEIIRQRVFKKATGISEEVYNRLVDIYTRTFLNELAKELKVWWFM
jgi:glutaminase